MVPLREHAFRRFIYGHSGSILLPGVVGMAYPEPIPALKGKAAKQFLERLESFELKSTQVDLYRGARESYRKKSRK